MTVEEKVAVDRLELRADLQPREDLDDDTVAEYARAMTDGDEFPPVEAVVSPDGGHMWVWDGFHRVAAAKRAGKERMQVRIETGTLRDAVLKSVTANATHGLRRSNADKRKAVTMLLEDPEWSQWSNREIARKTRTSHPFVAQVREELGAGNVSSARKYRDGSGQVRTMETGAIAEANQTRDDTGVNEGDLGMICRTSVEYATRFIPDANLATLRAALKYEQQHRHRSSLIEKLERRVRQLDPEVKAEGLSQKEVKAGIYAYLHEHYDEDAVASMLTELNDVRQWNHYASIKAYLDGEPAQRNGLIHAIDDVVRELHERRDAGDEPEATMSEIRSGVLAFLDEDYETDDLQGRIDALKPMLEARDYTDLVPYVPGNRPRGSLARAARQLVRALNKEKHQSRERESEQAEEPEYAPIWQLEGHIQLYLNTRLGYRGQGDVTEENLTRRLDILSQEGWIYDTLADAIDEPHRKSDLIQAVNNIADTLRQRVRAIRTEKPATVRYESVDVPESVEAIEVVAPQTEPRESEVRMQYLPKAEKDDEPRQVPSSDDTTITVSVVLDPEAEKFHLELSQRDMPYGPWRGKIGDLHRVLDLAIARVWPEAKALLTGESPAEAGEPEDEADDGPQVGDYVRWGSAPGQHGKLVNTNATRTVGWVRDNTDTIRKFPIHMLEVVQQAAVVQ
jgi:hypothetical protein